MESVCLLSHKSPDSHINVTVEFEVGEGKVPLDKIVERAKQHQPAPKATYKMIQEYVEKEYGFKVHTAYIAEVKRELGLSMYDAPNMVEELKQPRRHPTTEKIEATDAIGLVSKAGRYGGTYAHSDIAMSFATWISPEFQLYIMKDYRRLKTDENSRLSLNWNLNREISKLNYRIHTDAIKENLIPPELTPAQVAYTYANEADVLNVGLSFSFIQNQRSK